MSLVASVTRNAEAAIVIRQVSYRLSSTSADDGVTWPNGETRRQEWRESIHRSLVTFRFPVATHFFFFDIQYCFMLGSGVQHGGQTPIRFTK